MRKFYSLYKDLIYFISTFLFDIAAYYISLYAAYQSRIFMQVKFEDILPKFSSNFIDLVEILWIPSILIVFISYERLYTERFPYQEELRRIFKVIVFSLITVFFVVGLAKLQDEVSRLFTVFLFFYLCFTLPVFRFLSKLILHNLNLGIKDMLVVGYSEKYKDSLERLLKDRYLAYRLVGVIGERKRIVKIGKETYRVRPIKILQRISLLNGVHTMVIFSEDIAEESLSKLIILGQKIAKEVILIPPIKTLNVLNLDVIPMYFPQFLILKLKDNLKSNINYTIKSLFDYAFALSMLPILLLIGTLLYILIRLDSKGPAIIKQRRIGKGGKIIEIYKFRTMYENAEQILENILLENEHLRREWEEKRKLSRDPRVTRLGRFLRKSSLDELPQFINVLKGEMSIVGPRPITEEELKKYYGEFSSIYLQVKPGITGYWQVSGRSMVDYKTRVAMDVFYVLNWSIWLDFFILLKTVWVVIKGEGAI